jgi:hypothetical protein
VNVQAPEPWKEIEASTIPSMVAFTVKPVMITSPENLPAASAQNNSTVSVD